MNRRPAIANVLSMIEEYSVLYHRVSSKRQMDTAADIDRDGNSISTQREWTTKKSDSLNAIIKKEFIEPGASAQSIEKRPVFQEMLAYLKKHPEVKYVIVYMRSRAFRDFTDAAITGRALEKMGVRLISAKEDFGEGIMARAMEAVTDVMNDVQNKLTGQDISIKMENKARHGGTNGRAPLGYLNTRIDFDGQMVNSIGIDPVRGPLITAAFELYATGDYSIDRLYDTMEDLGLRTRPSRRHPNLQPVSKSKLHDMLRDPYYMGLLPYKGELHEGNHTALVSAELFERVQAIMDARSGAGQRDRTLDHYLKGKLFCNRCFEKERLNRILYIEAIVRRLMIETFYKRLRIDEHGQITDERQPIADDLHGYAQFIHYTGRDPEHAVNAARTRSDGRTGVKTNRTPNQVIGGSGGTGTDRLGFADYFVGASSKSVLVG